MKTKRRTSVYYKYSFVNMPASKPLVVYIIPVLSRVYVECPNTTFSYIIVLFIV